MSLVQEDGDKSSVSQTCAWSQLLEIPHEDSTIKVDDDLYRVSRTTKNSLKKGVQLL
jgi:hypothetical protein